VEATLERYGEEILTLQETAAGLEASVGELEETVDELQTQTDRIVSFFEQLRGLLDSLFGEPEMRPQGSKGVGE
jgi:phage shock protein A